MENQNKKHQIKATDYLIESLKLMVTISMLFIGGIVTYGGYLGYLLNKKYFYISVSFLVFSSLMSVININSLINKLYDGKYDAIRSKEVRIINAISILTLLVGIIMGIYSVLSTEQDEKQSTNCRLTVITDEKIIIGRTNLSSIKIIKNDNGKIQSIEIKANGLKSPNR